MNILVILLILALVALVALLWYGIRTHKTPEQLEAKINASVDAKLAAMKAETNQAIEAAKNKV
jgi:hypothetical protein